MHKFIFIFILAFTTSNIHAQDNPFIRLVELTKPMNTVTSSKQFIIGSTCKTCLLTVGDNAVRVYSTGAFAFELNLKPGDTSFLITATNAAGKTATKTMGFSYTPPKPAEPVKALGIESIQTFPEGNLILMAGDKIQFKVKAFPSCNVSTINGTVLYELPTSATKGMPGIYQGEYIVKATDSFAAKKIPVTITKDAQKITAETKNTFSILNPLSSDVAITKGRLAHLLYGIGDDRLGGAKIGYIDSMIPLKIIGKVAGDYKVQLAPYKTAYIPDDVVTLAPKGTLVNTSLTERWQVFGDSAYDYVTVGLTSKLPYQSFQEIDPSKIVVDVFGATNNTNWITQLQSVKEIKNVTYEQVQDGIFRINIFLKHKQHWGHSIYYKGNLLTIKIKQQPASLALKNLTIAVDAGHGGNSNPGAGGPTNSSEKELTLAISLKLQQALQNEGAKVIMTRTTEKFVDNKERILIYRDNRPDLLISIHLNSSADPIHAGGTSSLYRYIGFRNLSYCINKRMLQLGLKEYGNIGSFNFMLNSPTEYPNALVETLFLSNPAEEELVLDPAFQQKMADKIVAGLKDFLAEVKEDK